MLRTVFRWASQTIKLKFKNTPSITSFIDLWNEFPWREVFYCLPIGYSSTSGITEWTGEREIKEDNLLFFRLNVVSLSLFAFFCIHILAMKEWELCVTASLSRVLRGKEGVEEELSKRVVLETRRTLTVEKTQTRKEMNLVPFVLCLLHLLCLYFLNHLLIRG